MTGPSNIPVAAVTTRKARVEDADAIHAAVRDLAAFLGHSSEVISSADDLRRFGFGENPRFEVLIAEVGGEFAGVCISFPSFSTNLGRPGTYVLDLFVNERFRGHGVGETLLRTLAASTRSEGGAYLRLSVDAANVAAQRFYGRLGIAWAAEEHIHVARGEAFVRLAGTPQ